MGDSPFDLDQMQRTAIALAKGGRLVEARNLLVQLVESDPNREIAWVWLSDLMDSPEDRLIAMENALELHPGYRPYLQRLEQLRAQQDRFHQEDTLRSQEWMRQAAEALKDGRRDLALNLARHVTLEDPAAGQAWLLVANLSPDPAEQERALEAALRANPSDKILQRRLEEVRELSQHPLLLGLSYQRRGDLDLAMDVYNRVLTSSSSREERVEAATLLDFATFYQRFPEVKPVSPNRTLVRMATGPILLYLFLLLMQSGLNPLHAPLLPALGVLPTILGSFLLVLAGTRPLHPAWVRAFGSAGQGDEPLYRGLAKTAAWLMLLTPYALLAIDSFERLARLYQTLSSGGSLP